MVSVPSVIFRRFFSPSAEFSRCLSNFCYSLREVEYFCLLWNLRAILANLCFFELYPLEKLLPPIFPSQLHIQPDIKIPILQSHQQQAMLAHAQHNAQHNAAHSNGPGAQEIHLGASTPQGPPPEHFITVSHTSHLPHLSRHINSK